MEFLKTSRRRTALSEAIYIALNVGLSLALLVLVRVTGSLWPAFILVLLSKWRIFAVRPRFWFANIQANLVSVIVSISYVVFLYAANGVGVNDGQVLLLQLFLATLDALWLLFVKPKSKRSSVVLQAGVALFVGVTAIYVMSYGWVATPVVALMWLVGYATAKHVLTSYDDENHAILLSYAWGMIMAEIGWIAYHWTTAYRLPLLANAYLPQVTIITLSLGLLAYRAYNSYYHYHKIRINDIILPLVFTISIVGLLVVAFNGVSSAV